jgi:hypothetical protein
MGVFGMGIVTLEGVVEHGQIYLLGNVRLPDKTRVYVVVPDVEVEQVARIVSPRLARTEDLADFVLEVVEANPDAGI